MGDFATLRFGPKNASRRVVFGHGVGGLDFSANTFIKSAVEHWSTDPRLQHVEFIVPTAPTRPDGVAILDGAVAPAWFDMAQDATMPHGWRINREHLAESKQTYIDLATQDGGTLETTVFGGFSNGGAQALVTGLQTPCAGILCLCSSLFGFREFDDKDLQTSKPVLYCTGEKDPYIPVSEIEKDKVHRGTARNATSRSGPSNMGHESCEQELAVCANWLAKVLAVDGDDGVGGPRRGCLHQVENCRSGGGAVINIVRLDSGSELSSRSPSPVRSAAFPSALQLANTTAETRRRRQPADVRRKTLSAALRAVHSARLRTSTTHHAAASKPRVEARESCSPRGIRTTAGFTRSQSALNCAQRPRHATAPSMSGHILILFVSVLVAVSAVLSALGFKGRVEVIGVDLGTTYSVAAVSEKGRVRECSRIP